MKLYGHEVNITIEVLEAGPWHGYEISYEGYPMAFTHFCSSGLKEDWEKAKIEHIFIDKKQVRVLVDTLMGLLNERT